MKSLLFLILVISSFNVFAKCPTTSNGGLNSDQLIVKNLIESANRYKNEAQVSKDLTDFTDGLKKEYTQAAEFLNDGEIAAFIIDQDNAGNICPNEELPSSEAFRNVITEKIIDTYYGCGCEH